MDYECTKDNGAPVRRVQKCISIHPAFPDSAKPIHTGEKPLKIEMGGYGECICIAPREWQRWRKKREKSKGAAVASSLLWGGVEQGHFFFRTTQCQAGAHRLDPTGKASCSLLLHQITATGCESLPGAEEAWERPAAQSSAFRHIGSKPTAGQVCRDAGSEHAWLQIETLLSIHGNWCCLFPPPPDRMNLVSEDPAVVWMCGT